MKKLVVALFALFSFQIAEAQIIEASKVMSQGDNNSLTISLPDTDQKIVQKEWESYVKSYKGKMRKIKKSTEIFADDCKLEQISNNTVDVYAIVNQRGENTEVSVWFDLGGSYLNSEVHPEQYEKAEAMLQQFSGKVSKTYVANLLNEEQKKLKKMEGDYKSIEKSQENSVKDIAKFEEKIEEAKANIEDCKVRKEQAAKDIEAQKVVVKGVKKQLNN